MVINQGMFDIAANLQGATAAAQHLGAGNAPAALLLVSAGAIGAVTSARVEGGAILLTATSSTAAPDSATPRQRGSAAILQFRRLRERQRQQLRPGQRQPGDQRFRA